jgi:hypothetical protein
MARKEPYFQARIRESIRNALEKRMAEEGRLGSLNQFIEEILLRHVGGPLTERTPHESGGTRKKN